MQIPPFPGAFRPHVSLDVANIEQSISFYRSFFGIEPAKQRPGYAKFELTQPPLNFSMNERPAIRKSDGGTLSHLGIQVATTADVLAIKNRLEDAGLMTLDEMHVTCCYAEQDKVWVTDPDGTSWEVFVVTLTDSDVNISAGCCTPAPNPISITV